MLGELKAAVREALGPAYDALFFAVALFCPFLFPGILNWMFILSAIAVAFWLYLRKVSPPEERWSFNRFLKYLVPKSVFLHRSAITDYKFYLVNSILLRFVRVGAWVGALAGMLYITQGTTALIAWLFGQGATTGDPTFAARLSFSLIVVIAADFAKFWTHFLQHKIPALWEFHKVHHSAEVLTPVTNLRVHPVDVALEAFLTSIATGVVIGTYAYWYPGGVVELTILGTALVYFLFSLIGNLRHSHIRLQFPASVSKFLCSPFMHQIHHSCETRHFDKNFAVIFSLWDHMARTLWIPKDDEEFRLGIGAESQNFYSVWALYIGPFMAVGRKFKRTDQPAIR